MNKRTRILTAIAVTIVLGGMFAYQDAQKNDPSYQQHPVVCIVTDFFCGSLSGLIFYFGSGWLAKRKERKLKHPKDDKFYNEVARELQEKPMTPGLWTKAFAEMGGDDAKARALYIKYRVAQLAEEERAIREASEKAFKKKEEQRRFLIEPFTFELFKKEYRGEIPLRQYGRTEQQQMFEAWQKQKLESVGFFDASSENS